MWFNTAACDHPVTPPVAPPQSWSHCSHRRGQIKSHQSQGEQGMWGRAALGLCTNTAVAPELSLSPQGQGNAHPAVSRMETSKKPKMLHAALLGSLWGWKGLWGRHRVGVREEPLPEPLQGFGSGCSQRQEMLLQPKIRT